MQRELSSFDIYVIVSDLQKIIGSHINKIYQLSKSEILIKYRNIQNKNNEYIYIKNGEIICTTEKKLETPTHPSNFAMTLRKYLQNGRVTNIKQHEFDRIIKIKIGKKEGEYTLIIECFSDGNIILVNPEGKIILPLIKREWSHREIKSKKPYTPPPSQINPFKLTKEEFTKLLEESKTDLVRTLAVNINLSGTIAEEICTQANVEKETPIEKLDKKTIEKVYQTLQKFLKKFKEKEFKPVIVKENGKTIDVLPFEFESYKNKKTERVNNFTRSLQIFISTKKPKQEKKEKKLNERINKLKRRKQQQKKAIDRLNKKVKKKQFEGELIYLNYQKIKQLLDEIKQILEEKDKKELIENINQKDSVKKFDPTQNLLIVKLKDKEKNIHQVKLDFRKNVAENAEKAYDESKKFKRKIEGAKKALEDTEEKLEKTDKQTITVEKTRTIKKKEKTFWFEKFRWFISSDGNIVIAGKDAKSNEKVVKKYLEKGDRYAHADTAGAPSCVIKKTGTHNKKKSISEKTFQEACVFATSYSKAWKRFAEGEAYWVLPEQVSKTPQSGEHVPTGSFIIRGKRNYHRCKLQVAIGEITIDGIKKIMGGPISAVKNKADRYVIIKPGNIKKSDIANKISKMFDVSVDIINQVLPPGMSTIVKTVGFEKHDEEVK